MKRIVVVSDMQVPFCDYRAIRNLTAFIKKYKPDDVICVGDEIDLQTISRWSTGKDEWSGTIGADRDRTVEILSELQFNIPVDPTIQPGSTTPCRDGCQGCSVCQS